jgi:hypothetical protein
MVSHAPHLRQKSEVSKKIEEVREKSAGKAGVIYDVQVKILLF